MNRTIRLSALAATAALLAVPAGADAGKVKVWDHHAPAHYEHAQLKQAVVSSEGTLRLSRQLKPLADVDAAHVWDIVEDTAGNLLVATGNDGKLLRVSPEGKVAVAFASDDSEVLCLARATDGAVYAGTGPAGHILRVDPKGEVRIVADIPDSYVWSLAVDAAGTLYAGTGPRGRIYRLTPGGKPAIFYTTRQEHIHCLALAADGTLYAGTDKAGLVYRIATQARSASEGTQARSASEGKRSSLAGASGLCDDAPGKGFVLFSAPQSEVRRLLVTADGVYAGTSTPTKRHPGGSGTASAGSSTTAAALGAGQAVRVSTGHVEGTASAEGGTSSVASSSTDAKETSKSGGTAAAAPTSPGSGENSLYRLGPDGGVREVFREKAMILSLLRQNGHLFVGTGMDGQLFEVNETTREHSELARLDHGQVLCLCRRGDGSVVLGTGDPGKLYVLQEGYAARGSIVSEVLDAHLISKWGALRWKADAPAGTTVTVAVRSGNLAEPDETWSDWSSEQTDSQQAIAAAPPARFLQYRVTLTSTDPAATPAVHGLTLRYSTTNQAPEVNKVEVPDLDAGNLDNPKKLKFRWTSTDANEDELTYSLYARKEGWKSWVLLEEDIEKTEYEWDATTTPSGVYELKVVASDRKDNPAEDALTGERVSAPFVVSHTPPAVTVKVAGTDSDQVVLEATASDPLARLTAASFAVNGRKWVNVFPTDGLFDSKTETFRFKTDALKAGTYVVVLRVRDAAGNTGSGDVVFTVNPRPAAGEATRSGAGTGH
jgi:hypothetical protein